MNCDKATLISVEHFKNTSTLLVVTSNENNSILRTVMKATFRPFVKNGPDILQTPCETFLFVYYLTRYISKNIFSLILVCNNIKKWFCNFPSCLLDFLKLFSSYVIIPVDNYMFKVNNRNTSTRYEIGSKLTIKIPERRHWCRSGVAIVNFEHMPHLVQVFLLFTLNM